MNIKCFDGTTSAILSQVREGEKTGFSLQKLFKKRTLPTVASLEPYNEKHFYMDHDMFVYDLIVYIVFMVNDTSIYMTIYTQCAVLQC